MRPTPPPSFSDDAPPPGADGALPRTDPPRDALLAEALRRLDAVAPAELERIRRSIARAAAPRLAALRTRTWWEWTASWAGAAIPLALAAGIAALAFALRADTTTPQLAPEVTTASTATYSPAFISVIGERGARSQVTDAVVGPASHDWLVAQVVQP